MRVRSSKGDTVFHVTLSPAYKNASATFGGGVGVTAHMTHGVPDLNSTTVTAFPIKGTAKGPAFNPPSVPNSTIGEACSEFSKYETEKFEKEQRQRKDAKDPSTHYGNGYGRHNPASYGAIYGYNAPGACSGTSTGVMCQPD
jgi:hypothetical protein